MSGLPLILSKVFNFLSFPQLVTVTIKIAMIPVMMVHQALQVHPALPVPQPVQLPSQTLQPLQSPAGVGVERIQQYRWLISSSGGLIAIPSLDWVRRPGEVMVFRLAEPAGIRHFIWSLYLAPVIPLSLLRWPLLMQY